MLRVDPADRKIGLSRKRLTWEGDEGEAGEETPAEEGGPGGAPPKRELRGGTGSATGQLIQMPEKQEE